MQSTHTIIVRHGLSLKVKATELVVGGGRRMVVSTARQLHKLGLVHRRGRLRRTNRRAPDCRVVGRRQPVLCAVRGGGRRRLLAHGNVVSSR